MSNNVEKKRETIKVGDRDDQILVVNRNITSQAEYNKELGRVLAIASYKTYINKQVITPAIDLEVYEEYVRPTKALQDLLAIQGVLKEIEAEPIKQNSAAQKYTYDQLNARVPKTVKLLGKQGQNKSILLEAKSGYISKSLAKIAIGPRGGLTYELADVNEFISNILSKQNVIADRLIEQTMLNAPADLGDAYQKLLECVRTGEAVPENYGRVQLKLTGTPDDSGVAEDLIVHLIVNGKEVGTFGDCSGNLKTRKLTLGHIVDIVIPKAAKLGIYITKEK